MENYFTLAHATRTLEQKYTRVLAAEAAQKIRELNDEISRLHRKVAGSEEAQKERETNAELEKEREANAELRKRIAMLESALREKDTKQSKKRGDIEEEAMRELKEKNEEALKLLKQISKKLESARHETGTQIEYQSRIRKVEEELEEERMKNQALQRAEKEKRDNGILLKGTLEEKERMIKEQRDEIKKLREENSELRIPRIPGLIVPEAASTGMKQPEPWGLQTLPEVKKAKSVKKTKAVNVEKIMREENESTFFNDLSFSNTSPNIDRKYKMNFK